MSLYDLPLYQVFWTTRRLFQRLGTEFQPVPGGPPLSAAQRAVLEFLDRGGPQTVPDIARQRCVSRQHIQTNVNELLEHGWVETRSNPAHRRSPLISLSSAGRKRLMAAQASEEKIVAEIARRFDAVDLATTARTLAALEQFFDTPNWTSLKRRYFDKGETP